MSVDFHVVIPARYHSSRLPGKLLLDLHGKSILERVYQQACQTTAKSVIIATDHVNIFDAAQRFGADVMMTDVAHQSGTDRIAEVIAKRQFSAQSIVVNVQGDEPLIEPALIQQVARSLATTSAPMATLCWPIRDEVQFLNPNVVKVVRDAEHHALYFSRSPIPMHRDENTHLSAVYRHIGLYAYRAAFLQTYVSWPVCELERLEALEQLRVLWNGHKILVEEACVAPGQDINTAEDLAQAQVDLTHQLSHNLF